MNWFYPLGNKKKQLSQNNEGNLLTEAKLVGTPTVNIGTMPSMDNVSKTLRPKSLLDVEILKDKSYMPVSAGHDDYLYAINHGNKRIIRTNDGFETVESGYDFFTENIGEPVFVTKTPTGFLVYVNDKNLQEGSVWHSQNFSSGYVKVLDLTNGYVPDGFVARPWHKIEQGIVMVQEYSTNMNAEKPCRVWISRRGGAPDSWVLINKNVPTNNLKASHFHAVCYDPWQSRIYTSKGDYENRKLEYSDDWGLSWKTIPTTTQPTILEPMAKRIITCPDYGDIVSVNNLEKQINNDFTIEPFFKKAIGISSISSYGNFAKGPVGGVVGSEEMYVTFAESGSGVKKCFIAATGDGGESWHLVYTAEPLDGGGFVRGLVTDPLTGFMYGYFTANNYGDGKWSHMAKVKPINWI